MAETLAAYAKSFTCRVNHAQETAAMSKYVEELHSQEDATSVSDSVLFFLGLVAIVSLIGIVFWVAV
jgi:hypothetical protein